MKLLTHFLSQFLVLILLHIVFKMVPDEEELVSPPLVYISLRSRSLHIITFHKVRVSLTVLYFLLSLRLRVQAFICFS